ncbi:N-acylmannosamine kinase [Paenibacillus baekrokdamisoli]|uniref:N-acylmannosamine kinase n=1 Tax=Paenibacillus baekrokdamisoli TaxID=1712516 RepID=A0A3G9JB33_9BACL|nr:ROK family protein [Paenibacillus baekrokdamisoli]MBB3070938.1 glucokinase [Paenibacillus baekrokdamisoli]BBH22123.1 N-acylmannosamine kinase [Paenibacillus baekrokdamisoli]
MITYAGIDIGGTKCAVTIGRSSDNRIEILDKAYFLTAPTPEETIQQMIDELTLLFLKYPEDRQRLQAVGISCGGPLDSQRGLILSPPNLPHWDKVDVISPIKHHFDVPIGLQNDANACALAEWQWGAGQGTRNMIFLTFGTGMGAGLILDGRLYSGTNDNAGEVGHIRLANEGPIGYNKAGSFEGFCSGGGIARATQSVVRERIDSGGAFPSFCHSSDSIHEISTRDVAEAAERGDPLALRIFQDVGRNLGRGVAILIDILNPQKVIIGSIYGRQRQLIEPYMQEELHREALPDSLAVCEIVPAALGEEVGDYAALSVARTLHMSQSQLYSIRRDDKQ